MSRKRVSVTCVWDANQTAAFYNLYDTENINKPVVRSSNQIDPPNQSMLKFFKFATDPKFQLTIALILMGSAGIEIYRDLQHMSASGFTFRLHHGVFVYGLGSAMAALGNLANTTSIVVENTALITEATTDIVEVEETDQDRLP